MRKKIIIYTDGAASGNPGPGGFGVVMLYGSLRKEISEGFRLTTNNRMELLAVIRGLEAIRWEDAEVDIYTDSKYVSEAVNQGWLFEWEKKDFKKKKNPDLWKKFLPLYRKHNITVHWVKGHAGNKENSRCDELAVMASKGKNLPEDSGYDPLS
ncbi:MAG: ribonuclease HI [Bacteroidales bacterium]|nr:ribonuclease HI [Bacteroidales bacterium]MCB8999177.1 ribonuclease HI [Bacteroidales bacterium]